MVYVVTHAPFRRVAREPDAAEPIWEDSSAIYHIPPKTLGYGGNQTAVEAGEGETIE